jgi:hypothetical protein
MTSLDDWPAELRDRMREYGIEDLSVFEQQAEATESLVSFVEEQLGALQQEAEAVNARLEYLASVLAQYAGGDV